MTLSFWLTISGILLSFFGTILLIFSLPASFKRDSNSGSLFIVSGTPWDLFHHSVIDEKDSSIIFALILLIIGIIFQLSGAWLDAMPTYLYLSSRGLSLLGLALGFGGTACMIYGGMDTIIKVIRAEDGQYSLSAPIMAAKENSDYEESRKKNIQEYEYIGRRLLINRIGTWLLFIGFMIQFLALLSDH